MGPQVSTRHNEFEPRTAPWLPDSVAAFATLRTMSFTKRANHTEGELTRGGHLAVDGTRLTFTPHALDVGLGAVMVDVPLAKIVEVGVEPRSWNPFDGGLRRRLRVVVADGQRHLFVVNGVKGVLAELRGAIDAVRGS